MKETRIKVTIKTKAPITYRRRNFNYFFFTFLNTIKENHTLIELVNQLEYLFIFCIFILFFLLSVKSMQNVYKHAHTDTNEINRRVFLYIINLNWTQQKMKIEKTKWTANDQIGKTKNKTNYFDSVEKEITFSILRFFRVFFSSSMNRKFKTNKKVIQLCYCVSYKLAHVDIGFSSLFKREKNNHCNT